MTPEILLSNGRYFNFVEPDPNVVTLDVIAKSLSKQCRFSGQTSRFYSIAEHSVRASFVDPMLETLMHDAAEALVVDLPTPLKRMLPHYMAVDNAVERLVAERFGLIYPWPAATHKADQIMLATEARDLMPPHHWPHLDGVPRLAERLTKAKGGDPFLTWELAFLHRFQELASR